MKELGGEFGLESEPGMGTTIMLSIPVGKSE
jgi:signal transduction histidine kinase